MPRQAESPWATRNRWGARRPRRPRAGACGVVRGPGRARRGLRGRAPSSAGSAAAAGGAQLPSEASLSSDAARNRSPKSCWLGGRDTWVAGGPGAPPHPTDAGGPSSGAWLASGSAAGRSARHPVPETPRAGRHLRRRGARVCASEYERVSVYVRVCVPEGVVRVSDTVRVSVHVRVCPCTCVSVFCRLATAWVCLSIAPCEHDTRRPAALVSTRLRLQSPDLRTHTGPRQRGRFRGRRRPWAMLGAAWGPRRFGSGQEGAAGCTVQGRAAERAAQRAAQRAAHPAAAKSSALAARHTRATWEERAEPGRL